MTKAKRGRMKNVTKGTITPMNQMQNAEQIARFLNVVMALQM
tara:strand:- start:11118 stop:11243 length:126 start_codon:yes stop_codon:yes gene_type:complete